MDVDPPEKAIGAFHATVNVSATVVGTSRNASQSPA